MLLGIYNRSRGVMVSNLAGHQGISFLGEKSADSAVLVTPRSPLRFKMRFQFPPGTQRFRPIVCERSFPTRHFTLSSLFHVYPVTPVVDCLQAFRGYYSRPQIIIAYLLERAILTPRTIFITLHSCNDLDGELTSQPFRVTGTYHWRHFYVHMEPGVAN